MEKNFQKIKFGEKEYYIIACVEYEGVKYYYIIEDSFNPKDPDFDNIKENVYTEVNFIFKRNDGLYENVTNDELFAKLSKLVTLDYIAGINPLVNLDD